ncbi:PAS domain-containing protein [Yoonia sp.]|uniref:PAS domain-containing protein n=1 Tax=Yoonia sp. TaxID=2212373 RepID=UPI00391BF386
MSQENIAGWCSVHPAKFEIAEAMPQIVWSARSDGTVDWTNREFGRLTGLHNLNHDAEDWLLGIHPDDRAAVLADWREAATQTVPYRAECRLWSAEERTWRSHSVNARPHLDSTGQVTRWFGTATDIHDCRVPKKDHEFELRLEVVEQLILGKITVCSRLSDILDDICAAITNVFEGPRVCIQLYETPTRVTKGPVDDDGGSSLSQLSSQMSDQVIQSASVPIYDASELLIARFRQQEDAPGPLSGSDVKLLQRMSDLVCKAIARIQRRDSLNESDMRYRSLFDFLPIAIWEEDISDITAKLNAIRRSGVEDFENWLDVNSSFIDEALSVLHTLDANRAARRLYNFTDNPDYLFQAVIGIADEPEFRASTRDMLVAVWNGSTELQTSYRVPQPDGTKRDVLVWLRLPENGNGRIIRAEIDITAQRRVEDRFRHVAQASSDYIFDRDFASETTWVNDAASWIKNHAAGPCEVPRNAWVESVHPEDRDEILASITTAITTGEVFWEGEYRLRQIAGNYIPVLERASILRNEDGKPDRMIGNIIDLTERRELEAQLRQSQRLDAIGQLTGGVAHDFNNLLTVILGNAETLVDALSADHQAVKMAQQILFASERAADLTQRLLAFARKQPLSPGDFDANAVVKDMRTLVERNHAIDTVAYAA